MPASKPFDFSHLSVAERILLAKQLLDSVCPRPEEMPLTEAQRQQVERRWADFEDGRMSAASWDQVRKRLFNQ